MENKNSITDHCHYAESKHSEKTEIDQYSTTVCDQYNFWTRMEEKINYIKNTSDKK